MNLKLKALLGAFGILLCCAVAGVSVVQIITMIPVGWLPWLGVIFFISMAVYIIYNMLLNEMETQARINARLKELSEQK